MGHILASLPETPVDVLEISSRFDRIKLKAIMKAAEIFGFWNAPVKSAATAPEEMTQRDAYYWVHKSRSPVTKAEPGVVEAMIRDPKTVVLPDGFVPLTSLTFGAAGDLLWSDGLKYSLGILFNGVSEEIFAQDVSYANFESPITKQALKKELIGDAGPPTECCSREQFETLKGYKAAQFSILNIANNHIFDMGFEGIETTLETLEAEGIGSVGTNQCLENFGCGKVFTVNGIRLGFVSATFSLNGHTIPQEESYRVNVAKVSSKSREPNLELIKAQIADCRRQNCDFIIVSLHWGWEFEFFPRKQQIDIAHSLVEWGADAIIGHHPHVVQPVEFYRTQRDKNRIAVIAYSLGTLTWRFTAPHLVLSAILNLKISKGLYNGVPATYLETALVTPVFRQHTFWNGKELVRLTKLKEYGKFMHSYVTHSYLRKLEGYADLVFGVIGEKS